MNIGILCWDMKAPRGGIARAFGWLAEGLRERGMEVHIASSDMLGVKAGHLAFSVQLPFMLQRWIDTHAIDVLLLSGGPGGVFLWRAPKRCRLIITSYHTYAQQARLVPGEAWKRILVPLERHTLRMAECVAYAAEDTAVSLRCDYGLNAERLQSLAPVFPVEEWAALGSDKTPGLCVCVMRLSRRKGIDTLLRAWSSVVQACPSARLMLVGKGSAGVLPPSITHHEALPQAELRTLIARAQLALCPSYLEGFGLFAAEAMAAGTPVVAGDSEGLRTLVIHDRTGVLVPPGQSDAWARQIAALLDDEERCRTLGEQARHSMRQRFQRETALDAWTAVLQRTPEKLNASPGA
jgi:glycosyltransferase involved in cell wall biosynthesis